MGSLPVWLAPTVRALREAQPDTSIEVWEDNSARLLAMLDQRLLDLVIGRPSVSVHPEAYDFIPLEVEEICLVVDGADPLGDATGLRLADIIGNSWIVPQATLPMRALFEQLLDDEHLNFPRYAMETSSTFAMLSLLRTRDGTIGLIPRKVAEYFAAGGLVKILPFHIERRGAPYGIATRRGATPTQPVQKFIDLCRSRKTEF